MRGIKILRIISIPLMFIGTVLLLYLGTGKILNTDIAMTVLYIGYSSAIIGIMLFLITAIWNWINEKNNKNQENHTDK